LRLDPALGTRLNLGDCYEALGKLASAWAMYKAAADVARIQRDQREALATRKARQLEPRLPRLVVRVEGPPTPGMTIVRSGAALEPAMLGSATFVDPGRTVITASAPGYVTKTITIEAKEGGVDEVVIPALLRVASSDPTPTPARPQVASVAARTEVAVPSRRRALVVGGAGAGVLVGGLVIGALAHARWNDAFARGACSKVDLTCTSDGQRDLDSARTGATISTVTVGVGLAAIGVGAYLYLTGRMTRREATTARWVPIVTPNATGVGWGRAF
jgi:serine/threonine-protein kinase